MVMSRTGMIPLLPSYNPNSTARPNTTVDVLRNGCFTQYSTVACVRNGIISAVLILTALLCLVKLIKLHVRRHPTAHQYIIFYSAAAECLVCATHLVLGRYQQLAFVVQYLKLVQFVVVSHFYWTMASRVMRKEVLSKWLLLPAVVVALVYFTAVTVYGIINIQTSWTECLQPQWMMLSSVEFLMMQLFFLAGFYISRRLNEISTLESVRWAQKRDLWSIILVFELSALIGLVYDVATKSLGDEFSGCSGVFLHMETIYTPVFVAYMTVEYVLPIWVMLCVFQPMPTCREMDELLPAHSDEGTYTSVFSPAVTQTYRPLYQPGSDPQLSQDLSPPLAPLPNSWSGASPRRKMSNLAPISEEYHSSYQQHHANSLPDSITSVGGNLRDHVTPTSSMTSRDVNNVMTSRDVSNAMASRDVMVSTSGRTKGVQV